MIDASLCGVASSDTPPLFDEVPPSAALPYAAPLGSKTSC